MHYSVTSLFNSCRHLSNSFCLSNSPPLVPPRRRTIEWADLAAAYWQGVQTGAASSHSSASRSSTLPTAYDTSTSNAAAYNPFSVGPPPLEEVSSSPPHQYGIENLLDLTSPTRGSPPASSAAYDLEQLLSTGLANQARRETLERPRAQSAVNRALREASLGRSSHSSVRAQSSLEARIPPLPTVQSLGERMRPGESPETNNQRLSYLSSLLGIENGNEDDEDSDYEAEDQINSDVEDDEIDEAIRQLEPGRGGSSEELQQAEAAVERLASLFDGPSNRTEESSDDESMPPLEDIISNTNAGTSTASSVQATVQLDGRSAKDDTHLESPTGKRKSDDDSKQPAKKKIKKEEDIEEEETKESKANGSPKTCCICLDEPSKKELATINVCDHHFCFGCIDKWSDQENKCPLCKVRFYKIDKVHKPKKRKAGDAEGIGGDERSSKRVRNRNQRCDHLDFLNHPLEGMFASLESGGTWPTHIAQLLFSGLGGAPSSLAGGSFNAPRRNMPSSSRHPSSRAAALANARRQHEAAASRVASLRADIASRRQERAERLAERTARMQDWEESRRARTAAREARMASLDRQLADLSAARASLVGRGVSSTTSSASAIPSRSQASRVNRAGTTSNPLYHRSPFAIDTSSPWLSSSASSAMRQSQEGRTSSRHSFPPESSRRRRATSTTVAAAASALAADSTLLLQPGEEEEEERLLSTLSPGSYTRRLTRQMNGGSSAQYAFNTTRPPRWRRNIHQQSAAGAPPPHPSTASSSSSFRERMERIQRIRSSMRERNTRVRAEARAALDPPVQEAIEIDSDDDDDDDDVVEVIAVE